MFLWECCWESYVYREWLHSFILMSQNAKLVADWEIWCSQSFFFFFLISSFASMPLFNLFYISTSSAFFSFQVRILRKIYTSTSTKLLLLKLSFPPFFFTLDQWSSGFPPFLFIYLFIHIMFVLYIITSSFLIFIFYSDVFIPHVSYYMYWIWFLYFYSSRLVNII